MISIRLCGEIYSPKAIKEAKAAYDELANIKIEQNGDFWMLVFQNCRYGDEITAKEFENYLIGLENS